LLGTALFHKKRECGVKVIGLTGGIASGKSTAAKHLEGKGARLIDADLLGHQAYEPDTGAYRALIDTFGTGIVADDRSIDRKALGGEVFGKPERLKQLTDIVWPEIRRLAEAQIAAYGVDEPDAIVVLEAAVMLEAGWEDAVDEVWVIVVDPATACARAMERDNVPAEVVQKRIDAQLSNDERRARADIAIENSGDHTALTAELDRLWAQLAHT
jgi:phosphopantetheine adenylyltransferase/dephospho-CoA kinase